MAIWSESGGFLRLFMWHWLRLVTVMWTKVWEV